MSIFAASFVVAKIDMGDAHHPTHRLIGLK
jgi:hypothetical protein